jgi:hypothetical protein
MIFVLEHAGELCIINIKKKKGNNPYKPHTYTCTPKDVRITFAPGNYRDTTVT